MNVHMPHLDRLPVTPLQPVERLHHLELQLEELDAVVAIDVDVILVEMMLALTQELLASHGLAARLTVESVMASCRQNTVSSVHSSASRSAKIPRPRRTGRRQPSRKALRIRNCGIESFSQAFRLG